jgi:hypothetical protein
MSENALTCQIHKKYRLIECGNPPLAGDPQGFCILHSENEAKDPVAFQEALRARWEHVDDRSLDFRGVWFPFRFDPRDYFGTRVFDKPVDFSWACFGKEAIFSGAIFKEDANFLRARFTEEVHFYRAVFGWRVNFSHVEFGGEADFYGANFPGPADFRSAKIKGPMIFKGGYEPGRPPAPTKVFPRWSSFAFLQLGPEAVLRFQDLSLERVEFAGNDMRRMEFSHVQWHPYRERQALYDEILLRQAEKADPWFWKWFCFYAPCSDPPSPWGDKYGEVERLYRDLQENYEKARDYKKMGDFHYGEMEMHRRASKWRWFPFYWYNLYWALSGYGERPSRAFGLLIFFLVAMTVLLGWAGLEILDPKHSNGYGDPFFYLLQKVTLQRPTWAEPGGFWGKLVAGFSVLLIPGQAALFLLALRNRLGRRR